MLALYRGVCLSLLLSCSAVQCRAQLTAAQKVSDFSEIVAFYKYNYAPAAWKKLVFGFDLSDTASWFNRVQSSTDDLGFYEICYAYVASLNDSHSRYQMPSFWSASLGFTVDNYDAGSNSGIQPATGTILIDTIDRSRLPAGQYPFQVGDELLSVDGVGVEDWIRRLSTWTASSNARSKRSTAAQGIVVRSQVGGPTQAPFPRAPLETGPSAVVQIRRQSGAVETYTINWLTLGAPIMTAPPVKQARMKSGIRHFPLRASVQPVGSLAPGFAMPPGFQQRLGNPGDFFFSGVFPSGNLRIGYLRISAFGASSGGAALPDAVGIAQLAPEIAYLQANTDALVIDVMHNPGGSPTYADSIYSYISPQPYQQLQAVWRPTLYLLGETYFLLAQAEASYADPATIAFYQSMFQQVSAANAQGADFTPLFPLVGTTVLRNPATDNQGNVFTYTKPIMLMTDDQSVSAADAFAALFQDNRRGIIFGVRTNGAGGNSLQYPVGRYSQGQTGDENNLNVRNHVVNVPGYPAAPYFDSIGVQPDIAGDLLTKENLLNNGASFSQAMVTAITNYVQQQKGK
ncbi:MAG TPA: S41 family peptidase [Bryobacteraceae bacterium]|nr:S41 family peptidase [Bryobacteraceae bacterium]